MFKPGFLLGRHTIAECLFWTPENGIRQNPSVTERLSQEVLLDAFPRLSLFGGEGEVVGREELVQEGDPELQTVCSQ